MTDLEMVKWCAEAMEMDFIATEKHVMFRLPGSMELHSAYYWPLQVDAQAMALIKRFRLNIEQLSAGCKVFTGDMRHEADSHDLNRAIVECTAKMQAAKGAKP